MTESRMKKTHKKFLVWTQFRGQSQNWSLEGESDDWSRASNLAISCLDRTEVTEVIISEFIPLIVIDGRESTYHMQEITKIEDDQIPTGLYMDKRSGVVYVEGNSINLTPLEFILLSLLYEREAEIVSESDICLEVWNEEYIPQSKTDARIDQLINRLRKKLESDPSNPKFIVNIRGRGYRLNAMGEK